MTDPRRKNLADILVNYCVDIQPKEWVVIIGNIITEPLMDNLVEKVLQAGGYPNVLFTSGELEETHYRFASDEQLMWVSPFFKLVYENAAAVISLWGTRNLRSINGIAPEKMLTEQAAMKEVYQTFSKRMADGTLKWVGTQFPCQAYAQEASMSLHEQEDFVYGATLADQPNPVEAWKAIKRSQQQYVNYLKGKKNLHIRGEHVDLRLSVEERGFLNDGGELNMPGGEIYTSPVENSANGWVEFSYPAIESGREVEGIRLEFIDGKVVKASAEKNDAFLQEILGMDEGARYLGEFAIGTNYGIQKFSKSILFDEKIGGTIHLALGRGFPQIGGQNQSSLHWDMICDMHSGEIAADGEVFYRNGKFTQ